jgi:hypothetical protein
MANEVYANGREIACKAASGKSICAFPDVCLTPPPPPAGPIPVPYPNTGFASDTTNGSKTVMISGQEVMLKDQSTFKKSTGDEAATKAQGMGVVTHQITGEVSFTSWSMDVKIEGENADRHLDMTLHNEQCNPANTPPQVYVDSMAFGNPPSCSKDSKRAQDSCGESKRRRFGTRVHRICSEECKKAMECILVPKGEDKEKCCRPDNTGDHLIEDHWVRPGGDLLPSFAHIAAKPGGAYDGAPCMCVNRSRYKGKHGVAHAIRGVIEDSLIGKSFTYAKARSTAIRAHKDANPNSKCSAKCIKDQLDSFYGKGRKDCATPERKQPLKEKQRADALKRVFPKRGMG